MGNPRISTIIQDTRRLINEKLASVKHAEITGMPPSSMPGAEHDSKVPEEFKQPDPEVAHNATEGPPSARSATGAGDDNASFGDTLYDSEEAVLDPDKEPVITDDANAKTAASMANDILRMVRAEQTRVNNKTANSHVNTANSPKNVPAPEVKQAGDNDGALNIELTSDILAKIAAIVLSTEEGAAVTDAILRKTASDATADEVLGYLAQQSDEAEKIAAYKAGADTAVHAVIEDAYAQGFDKGAEAYAYKMGQDMADATIADMMTGDAGAEYSPEELAALEATEGAEGADVADVDITIEDVVQAVEEMVNDGELAPDEAEAVLEAVIGDAGAAPAVDPGMDPVMDPGMADMGKRAEDISVEDVVQAVEEMVNDGELGVEEGAEILAEIIETVDPEAAAAIIEAASQELAGAIDTYGADVADVADATVTPEDEVKLAAARDLLEKLQRIRKRG